MQGETADFVAKLGEPILELVESKLSDVISDIGCGDCSLVMFSNVQLADCQNFYTTTA
jgi:hypothetical protein